MAVAPAGGESLPELIDPAPLHEPVVEPVIDTEEAERRAQASAAIPRPKTYRVMQTTMCLLAGGRTTLRAGKVLDERFYDIQKIADQGVPLREIAEA